jgi:hypothetical protein
MLVIWITDHRMQGYAISTAELRLKATHLARQSDTMANFRGSISWSYAFFKRHDLVAMSLCICDNFKLVSRSMRLSYITHLLGAKIRRLMIICNEPGSQTLWLTLEGLFHGVMPS